MTRALPLWIEQEQDSDDEDGALVGDGYSQLGYWAYSCSTIARWAASARRMLGLCCPCCRGGQRARDTAGGTGCSERNV